MAFSGLTIGINPFSSAVFAVMVDEKIPVLIPFLFTSIIQLFLFGYVNALRFLGFAVIYSIIKAFSKNKSKNDSEDIVELLKYFVLRVLTASLISEIILLATGVEEVQELYAVICLVLSTAVFSIVFNYAYKCYFSLTKEAENPIKFVHISTFLLMCVICISIVKNVNLFGFNLWIALSIILLMMAVWRKNLVFGVFTSILVSLIFMLCLNVSISILILALVVGIVTSLLSKANRKGALIGLVFSFIILMFITINNSNGGFLDDARMQKDYLEFLKDRQKYLSGDELLRSEEELDRIETLTQMQENSQNTISSLVLKCMIVGFFLICVIPIKYLDLVNSIIPDAPSPKQIKERLFRVSKIYWLNPGNENNKDK